MRWWGRGGIEGLSDPTPLVDCDRFVMPLALSLYSAVMRLATPIWLARFWWRGQAEPLYRHAMGERLALGDVAAAPALDDRAEAVLVSAPESGHESVSAPLPESVSESGAESRPVWIHAVSLGETHAAAPLIDELRRRCPGMRLLLTHSTATGRTAGARLLRKGDTQAWLPIDTPGATRRFLARYRPRLGILMETEVWPNLIDQARRAGVPMALANARLSERSLVKGLRWRLLLRPAAAGLAMVLAQTEDDARRLRQMGAGDVKVCGNLKYDVKPDPEKLAKGRALRAALGRPVVLAASTREGEEAMLLDAWVAQLKMARARSKSGALGPKPKSVCADVGEADRSSWPLLVIVPRHPQRFDEVEKLITRSGLCALRRSRIDLSVCPGIPAAVDVLLGDSMGEMPMYYGLADTALLGGSFGPYGGQNLIEAVSCGCMVVVGPSIFNFDQAARLMIEAGLAVRSGDLYDAVERAVNGRQHTSRGGSASLSGYHDSGLHRSTMCHVDLLVEFITGPIHHAKVIDS